ncbi:MAG TPA: ADP-forming succinate--CoA ligase subunit beta [Aestuariivirgaceae bacterium]|jgi:succinyl-CoA synthetase beta subunit
MNIHEYQAKAVLKEFGVPVPEGLAAFTVEEAVKAAQQLGGSVFAVKAQIHAGGRGKGGGVKIARSLEEVDEAARQMLGMTLITKQTGPKGRIVNRLYVEKGVSIAKELYLSCLVDRASSQITFIASTEGGMDIEEVAQQTPEKIATVLLNASVGYSAYVGRRIASALKLKGEQMKQCAQLTLRLAAAFQAKDMSLLEINPLIVTAEGRLLCLDAKVTFEDNALDRHPEIKALRDESEEDPKEIEAHRHELSYVALDGSIGCMVNGAGLAMATMDIIKLYGAEPANFLDVGGGASKEKVTAAFKIITADARVKGILVNIFGGIMRCDTIAEGVIAAVKEVGLSVPLVVRLEGTNADLGRDMLRKSGLDVTPAIDLDDAAKKIVAAVEA